MGWQDRPQAGEVWRRSILYRFTQERRVETRTVVDRNLGGDVFYMSGRVTRHAKIHRCTEAEWMAWQKTAKHFRYRGVATPTWEASVTKRIAAVACPPSEGGEP